MYLSGIGSSDSSVAVPIVGSDRVTTGYSPTTMHVDPVTGVPFDQEAANTTVIVQPVPASSGMSWMLILALAGIAYYGYKQGWFDGLFESEPESTTVIERRAA